MDQGMKGAQIHVLLRPYYPPYVDTRCLDKITRTIACKRLQARDGGRRQLSKTLETSRLNAARPC
eukprot:scaffold154152_cov28-Tisochrysis_lutea.AAC.2